MLKAFTHYNNAVALRARILAGPSNQTPVMAWATVCRECAAADFAFRTELKGQPCGRSELSFLNNLDAIWWWAKAQREHYAKVAA